MMQNKEVVKVILFYDDFCENIEKKMKIFQQISGQFTNDNIVFG